MIKVVTHSFYFSFPEEAEAAEDFEKRFGKKYIKDADHPDLTVFTKTETVYYGGYKGDKIESVNKND